ncbi:MAG: SCO family protein [Flavobacteriaceae bacterium]
MSSKKRDWSYILVSFVVLIFGIWAVPKIVDRMQGHELVKFEKVPDFSFTNQDGEIITQKDFEGKVYVLEFFFTSCPTICPVMNTNMLKLQDAYYGNPDFGIVSISINPSIDTPEVLKAYMKEKGVTMKNWEFLTGPQQEVLNFSNTGFRLYAGINDQEPGGFEHSGLFALVDKDGYIRSRVISEGGYDNPIKYYDGLSLKGIQMIKEDIAILLNQ